MPASADVLPLGVATELREPPAEGTQALSPRAGSGALG
jgi:hypothetical protein